MAVAKTTVQKPTDFETGVVATDLILGGCLPKGKIIEINGESQVGKSSLVLYMASKILKQGGKVLYVDVERGVNEGIMTNMGIDKYLGSTFNLIQEVSMFSEFQGLLDEALGKPKDRTKLPVPHENTPDIIVLDSLAMLIPDAAKEKAIDDNVSNNMLAARYITQMFKDLVGDISATNTTFIFINHLQTKMKKTGFFQQVAIQDSAGPNMVKYGPDIRLVIDKSKKLTKIRKTAVGDQEAKYGTEAEIWSKKSRLEDNEIRLPIMIIDGFGVFNGHTLYPICRNAGWIDEKSGGHITLKSPLVEKDESIRGTENAKVWLQKNVAMVIDLLKKEKLYKLTYDKENVTCMSDIVGK